MRAAAPGVSGGGGERGAFCERDRRMPRPHPAPPVGRRVTMGPAHGTGTRPSAPAGSGRSGRRPLPGCPPIRRIRGNDRPRAGQARTVRTAAPRAAATRNQRQKASLRRSETARDAGRTRPVGGTARTAFDAVKPLRRTPARRGIEADSRPRHRLRKTGRTRRAGRSARRRRSSDSARPRPSGGWGATTLQRKHVSGTTRGEPDALATMSVRGVERALSPMHDQADPHSIAGS